MGGACGTNGDISACRVVVGNPESIFLNTSSRFSELYVQNKMCESFRDFQSIKVWLDSTDSGQDGMSDFRKHSNKDFCP